MVELSPKARALLREQRKRYLTRLPERARELRLLWEAADGTDYGEFLDAVHRLAGSAGLHGLDRIQQDAAMLEQGLKSQARAPASYAADLNALIERLLAADGAE